MKIITFEVKSSSLSFRLFNEEGLSLVASGGAARIAVEGSNYYISNEEFDFKTEEFFNNHDEAALTIIDKLISVKLLTGEEQIASFAVKVIHGAEVFSQSVIVTDKVLADINQLASFEPKLNPISASLIKALRSLDNNRPVIAVFETALYQSMEAKDYLYPLPYRWYNQYGVRKYGYYGTSHRYVYQRMKDHYSKDINVISCYLGNSGSITALRKGEAIDSSMGFTPVSGLMMGSRSGDIDPSIISFIMERDGKSASEVLYDLENKSGFLGITEMTSEVKDISEAMESGSEKAKLAIDMFIDSVVSYIAEYYVKLGSVDALCFTAGIGVNATEIRKRIVDSLAPLGIELDENKNKEKKEFAKISSSESKVEVYVVPSDEHMMMAIDAQKYIR